MLYSKLNQTKTMSKITVTECFDKMAEMYLTNYLEKFLYITAILHSYTVAYYSLLKSY